MFFTSVSLIHNQSTLFVAFVYIRLNNGQVRQGTKLSIFEKHFHSIILVDVNFNDFVNFFYNDIIQ